MFRLWLIITLAVFDRSIYDFNKFCQQCQDCFIICINLISIFNNIWYFKIFWFNVAFANVI